jgi:hypothetical protein
LRSRVRSSSPAELYLLRVVDHQQQHQCRSLTTYLVGKSQSTQSSDHETHDTRRRYTSTMPAEAGPSGAAASLGSVTEPGASAALPTLPPLRCAALTAPAASFGPVTAPAASFGSLTY